MKMRFLKWLMVFALIIMIPMANCVVYAEEALKPEETDGTKGVKDTTPYTYIYTEADKVTIGGTEYAGIVIPIEQAYAGILDVFVDGIHNVTTTDGNVYCALFDDMNFSVAEAKQASRDIAQLESINGETGIRYLVFYNDTYEGELTTTIQFQIGLSYTASYDMKENITYKNYARDSQIKNYATLELTKPGYYIFETDQDITLRLFMMQGNCAIIPADDMSIAGKTNHKVMIGFREMGTYNVTMTSQKGVPFSISYTYYPSENLELTETNTVPVYICDTISLVAIQYTADKTGVVELAGVSKSAGEVAITQSNSQNSHMVYKRIVPTSSEITDATKTSFFVRKGESYSFLIYATSRYKYVNAYFKITGFTEADVLGKPTMEDSMSAKNQLQYDTVYYGTFDRSESIQSWIYIDKPCRIHFNSYKKNAGEGYTLNYYDGTSVAATTTVKDENKEVKFFVLDHWAPGYLEIIDEAGGGYYTLMIEETVPSVGDTLKGKDATYRVTASPKKASKTGGVVSYVKPAKENSKSVKIPDTVTIHGIKYKVGSIEESAFAGNKKLTTVKIGKNVTTIGNKAFYKCEALTKITIPSKVSKIGKSAFQNCKKLKSIIIQTTKLTSKKVGKNAFKGVGSKYYKKVVVKVPAKKLKSYKTLLKKAGLSSKAKVKKK